MEDLNCKIRINGSLFYFKVNLAPFESCGTVGESLVPAGRAINLHIRPAMIAEP